MTATPLNWYGGKMSAAAFIVSQIPAHRTYVEPFFGGGAVLFEKKRCAHEVLNDVNGAVVAFWRALRESPEALERVCALTPFARDEWAAADLAEDVDDLELARRLYLKTATSYGHSMTAGFAYSTGQNGSKARAMLNGLDRFSSAAHRLSGCLIENQDAVRIIERFGSARSCVIYADPPYVPSSRRSTSDYEHEMSEAHHRELANALRDSPATVLLSGYHSPLYDELYADWDSTEFGARHTDRAEVLWSNRPLPINEGVRP
mgnify:CR=1 FL=1